MSDRFIIVASGPSAKCFNPPDDVTVISVNQSIKFLRRVDHWFTLDCTLVNYRTLLEKRKNVTYWCALDDLNRPLPEHVNKLKRVSQKHEYECYKGSVEYDIKRYSCKLGLDKRQGHISTGNSAYGALNLALHLGAKKVVLIGVDANLKPKLDNTYSKTDLKHLPLLFDSATNDIDFVSCGEMTGNNFKTLKWEEGYKWLMS